MKYPEYRDAEYSTTDIPTQSFLKAYGHKIKKYIFLFICFLLILFVLYYFFILVIDETEDNRKLASVSVGSALITAFSALISMLTLVSSNSLKKYDDDINLLQTRYLEGKNIYKWEFLKRSSYYLKNPIQKHNYYISSACYKLYCDETDKNSLVIVVPVLEVDFYDIPCIRQIKRIKKFIPSYFVYINSEQKKYDESGHEMRNIPPSYYLPLANHLIALYKKILIYKVAKSCIEICFLFIVSSICITIIGMC